MTTREAEIADNRPPFWLAILVSSLLVGLMGLIRLYIFREHFVPLAYGVPMLVVFWHRYRSVLWGMAAAFVAITVVEVFWALSPDVVGGSYRWLALAMYLVNILVVAAAFHVVLANRSRLVQANASLATANAELAASNEELAAREEEISGQNEELQSQAEEMEQQAEELGRQSEELQTLNAELQRREGALQVLLESSRWLRSEGDEEGVFARICQLALQLVEPHGCAAAIVQRRHENVAVLSHHGFGPNGMVKNSWAYEHSLASVVMERGQTACLNDKDLRPDLEIPQSSCNGQPLRSMLASPLRVEGQIIGALEVYSHEVHEWTEQEFGIIEWLASQSSLVLESLQLQKELELRRQEAEEATVHKTGFLAAVSHDVRTPANAINLMAELIIRAANDPAMSRQLPELAADLQANAKSLIALVSDVLDLARFDSGRLDLQETEFAICEMVEAEVRQLLPLAQAKGLSLCADRPVDPIWLRADRMKLARVVGNLLGNAIKFTESGSVSVQCLRLPDGHAEIRVIDTGVGISSDHLPRIFDEFFQLRNPERDRSKGTGLGLAICKRLLEAMGCDITVHSAAGQGSTFTLIIPPTLIVPAPDRVEPQAGLQPCPIDDSGPLAALHILLVEDHDTTRRAIAQLLASHGATVMQAEGGRTAIHMLSHANPQVLLLDLMLPDIDGSEVLRHLQHSRPNSLRCVLAVSGDVTAARQEEVRHLGADGLIAKPVDLEQLVQAIHTVLSASVSDELPCTDR